jgi:membrane glycosyltransferase
MFKKSNAFFTRMIEKLGKLMEPHKYIWTGLFLTWVLVVFVLRMLRLAPDWLFNLWIWTTPLLGAFALVVVLSFTGYFKRLEAREETEAQVAIPEERRAEREIEAARALRDDKTRPDRR